MQNRVMLGTIFNALLVITLFTRLQKNFVLAVYDAWLFSAQL